MITFHKRPRLFPPKGGHWGQVWLCIGTLYHIDTTRGVNLYILAGDVTWYAGHILRLYDVRVIYHKLCF